MRRNSFKTRKFERLEARQMMAGDISFANGILTITGDSLDDQAEIRVIQDDGDFKVKVDLFATDPDEDDPEDLIDHHDQDEDIDDVTEIRFNGGSGNDRLTVFVNNADAQRLAAEGITLSFNGEAGDDTLDNTDPQGGIKTTADGGLNNDTLEGGRFDDTFTGGSGNDITIGGRGNDTYKFSGASFGTDEIHEAANVDTDTLDFSQYERSIFVNLDRVFNPAENSPGSTFAVTTFNFGQVKQFNSTGLEDVKGTAFGDTIDGNSRPNHLWGGGEKDKLAGLAGNDILEGQAGDDTYEFAGTGLGTDDIVEAANSDSDLLRFGGMTTGLTIDISKSGPDFAVDNANLRLRLSNSTAIERVNGTQFADTIFGNSRENVLKGVGGRDTIFAIDNSADTVDGGEDDDILWTDALDQAFGGLGQDFFDGIREARFTARPRARYIDWGLIS